jgi:hypothetical protein
VATTPPKLLTAAWSLGRECGEDESADVPIGAVDVRAGPFGPVGGVVKAGGDIEDGACGGERIGCSGDARLNDPGELPGKAVDVRFDDLRASAVSSM